MSMRLDNWKIRVHRVVVHMTLYRTIWVERKYVAYYKENPMHKRARNYEYLGD